MKSGPTLKPATRRPRSVKAAIRPVATVVLPTPEWVPATTTLAVIGSPSAWRSPLDSLLAADALVEGMLELAHLGDEVGDLDQRRGGVATGDDDVLEAGAVAQHVDHFGGIDPAERHRIGELVEDQNFVRRVADAPLDLGPALAGEVGGLLEIAGDPGPAVAHALPGDVAQPLGRLPLADAPLAGLHELVDADPVAAGPGAQHDAERGGGLAFALAGVDDQQRVVPPGARDALAPGRGLPGISGHATRLFRGRLGADEPGARLGGERLQRDARTVEGARQSSGQPQPHDRVLGVDDDRGDSRAGERARLGERCRDWMVQGAGAGRGRLTDGVGAAVGDDDQ